MADDEGIVYADVDIARCVEPKQFHDVVGYYNRFDIFRLHVDRSPREPLSFGESAQAAPQAAPRSGFPVRLTPWPRSNFPTRAADVESRA